MERSRKTSSVRRRLARRGLPAALLCCALLGPFGCAPAHIAPAPVVRTGPYSADRDSIAASARSLIGAPYRWAGNSPRTGFDCSGLAWWVYRQAGVRLPRRSFDQYEVGAPVNRRDIRAGDLVFFSLGSGVKSLHVGIATGGGTFVHSPRTGGRVREDFLDAPFWREHFLGARRYLASGG